MHFVKLWDRVLDSSVWHGPDHVLRVFLASMCLCDRKGILRISVPGLAHRAVVTVEECLDAIAKLEAPDPHSFTVDAEGARLVRHEEAGERYWEVTTYLKYREMRDQDKAVVMMREKQRRYRERRAGRPKQPQPPAEPPEEAPAEPPPQQPPTPKKRKAPKPGPETSGDFNAFWATYPRRVAKEKAWKAWRDLDPDPDTVRAILAAVVNHSRSEAWAKEGGKFIPYPASWLNGKRWTDEPMKAASKPGLDEVRREQVRKLNIPTFGDEEEEANGRANP